MPTSPAIAFTLHPNATFGSHMEVVAPHYRHFPLRISVPAPEAAHPANSSLQITDTRGHPLTSLARPFLHWPDGSIRAWEVWLPLDLPPDPQSDDHLSLVARVSKPNRSAHPARPARPAAAPVPPTTTQPFPTHFTLRLSLSDGIDLSADLTFPPIAADAFIHQDEQPFEIQHGGGVTFGGVLRRRAWSFYPGIELALQLTNRSRNVELLTVKAARLEFDLPLRGPIHYTVRQSFYSRHRDMPVPRDVRTAKPLTLRASSGDTRVTDIAQLDEDPAHYPPYERPGIPVVAPWLAAGDADSTWLLLVDEACQRYPKQWTIRGARAVVDLHPDDAHPLDWRQGMSMFQRLHLVRLEPRAAGAALQNEALAWERQPLVRLDPAAYRAAGWRLPFRHDPARFPKVERHFRDLFAFSWFPGTFYWGDDATEGFTLAAYLAATPEQRSRFRPRNGEYDITAAAAREYARTGHGLYLRMCRNAAEHLMYTDFVVLSDDPWKDGGVPAHTRGHTSGTAYPSHMWVEGLTLYHQLTGDPYALHVACRIGDLFVKYARERFDVYRGTPREGGWALISLAALYDLTRQERYLAAIRQIVDCYIAYRPEEFFPASGGFMIGIAIVGLDRARPFYADARIRRFIPPTLDWQIQHRMSPDGIFAYHLDAESDYAFHVEAAIPEALNIAYLLTGKEKYLRLAFRQFEFWQAGVLFHSTGDGPALRDSRMAAAHQMSWMGALASFAKKKWLDRAQFRDAIPRSPRTHKVSASPR